MKFKDEAEPDGSQPQGTCGLNWFPYKYDWAKGTSIVIRFWGYPFYPCNLDTYLQFHSVFLKYSVPQ